MPTDLTAPTPVRYARIVGATSNPVAVWGGRGCHEGRSHRAVGPALHRGAPDDFGAMPGLAAVPEAVWAEMTCARCGERAPADADRHIRGARVWDTPSGELEPGCLYRPTWYESADPTFMRNPDGSIHLHVMLPCGCHWNIDAEASNCTRPGDRTHKCWVRHGDPEDPQGERTGVKFHVDKAGDTCAAGAGSIICGCRRYHGFLHHGALTAGL